MNKRTKALAITHEVKEIVWKRDNRHCILCGNPRASPNAHFISRAQGGLGIEQNIVTLCAECHRQYDQSVNRSEYKADIEEYLMSKYPDWDKAKLIYRKGIFNA